MPRKRKIQNAVDLCMVLLLPVMMSYSLAGEQLHEVLGMTMGALFLCHTILNRQWYCSLLKGRYTLPRILQTTVNLLLVAVMILLPLNGLLMAKHIPLLWGLNADTTTSRTIHMLAAYWGFLLMSVHLGFHWSMFMKMAGKLTGAVQASAVRTPVLRAAGLVIAGYGCYAFFKRDLPEYLLMKIQFVFFDYSENLLFFLLDYLAVMGLFVWIGHYVFQFALLKQKTTNDNN